MAKPKVVKQAIQEGKFESLLCGIGVYVNRDRYDPSPINYREVLDSVYELMKEDDKTISVFLDTLKSICTNGEGIYIAARYIYTMIYDIASGDCDIKLDIDSFTNAPSNVIEKYKIILKNTTDISVKKIHVNLYEHLVKMDKECYRNNNVHLFHEINDSQVENGIASTNEIMSIVDRDILNGEKTPHGLSNPVLFKDGDIVFLAVFVFFYNRVDYVKGMLNRPTFWALADISTGNIVSRFETKEKDFSDAPYEKKYNIRSNQAYDLSNEYYAKAYGLMDKVREHYLKCGEILSDCYRDYLKMVLANVPEDYQRFYKELSNI